MPLFADPFTEPSRLGGSPVLSYVMTSPASSAASPPSPPETGHAETPDERHARFEVAGEDSRRGVRHIGLVLGNQPLGAGRGTSFNHSLDVSEVAVPLRDPVRVVIEDLKASPG